MIKRIIAIILVSHEALVSGQTSMYVFSGSNIFA